MTRTGNKRYICSFVKKDDHGELKPHVVVVAAVGPIIARAILCQKYGAINKPAGRDNKQEGIKTIREAETNTYEGEPEGENFSD